MTVMSKATLAVASLACLGGCAGLRFHDQPTAGAFTYYEPQPFLLVKRAADCSFAAEVISLPGQKRSVAFKSGMGSAKLSVKVANGVITDIGQETDTKVPETVTALTGLAKQLGGMGALGVVKTPKAPCTATVSLHAIITGANGVLTVEKQAAFSQ